MQHVTIYSWSSHEKIEKTTTKSRNQCLLVLMHVDIHSETAACVLPDFLMKHLYWFQTQSSLMIWFKAFSCHVIVIPFHRSSRKRYMQYFYQQFRLCHRDNHGEFLLHFFLWLISPMCQCVIYPSTCRSTS